MQLKSALWDQKKKTYKYNGRRIKLENPIEIIVGWYNAEFEPKIKFMYRNDLRKAV